MSATEQHELVRMANQIADFYRSYPEEEAVDGIAQHIRDFWDPRMRRGLAALLAEGKAELGPRARAAAERVLAAKAA